MFAADRAIYFHVYANSKQLLAPYLSIDSPSNHLLSSGCASQYCFTLSVVSILGVYSVQNIM